MNPRFKRLRERALQVLQSNTVPVPSPCQSVCVMHPGTGWCEGCTRTLQEIADWSRLHEGHKRGVWQAVLQRVDSGASIAT